MVRLSGGYGTSEKGGTGRLSVWISYTESCTECPVQHAERTLQESRNLAVTYAVYHGERTVVLYVSNKWVTVTYYCSAGGGYHFQTGWGQSATGRPATGERNRPDRQSRPTSVLVTPFLKVLSNTFPNIHFITTIHSPLIAMGAADIA